MWRRLVARYLGVVEAVGSSPVTPTIEGLIQVKILLRSERMQEPVLAFKVTKYNAPIVKWI